MTILLVAFPNPIEKQKALNIFTIIIMAGASLGAVAGGIIVVNYNI